MERATQNPGSSPDPSAAPAAPAQTASEEKWPFFPNGHRSLGLAPADLIQAHLCLEEAASFKGDGGWEADDWLHFWMEEDPAYTALVQRAKEAGHGWNIGQWLWLWVSQADRPQPPPAPPLATGLGSDAFPLSQLNETVTVTQIYCRSTCQDCGVGHCGVSLTRADQPRRHRCSICYKASRRAQGQP